MEPETDIITDEDIDAIRELITIGVGHAASMLNDLTRSHIMLEVPSARMVTLADLAEKTGDYSDDDCATVDLSFRGGFSGTTALVIPKTSAAVLVMALTGELSDTPDLDLVRADTLIEVGNIIINGIMGSIANTICEPLSYTFPAYGEGGVREIVNKGSYDPATTIIIAMTRFTIRDLSVTGEIFILLEIGSLRALIEKIRQFASHSIRE